MNFAELMTVDLMTGMNVPDLKAGGRQPRQSVARTSEFGKIFGATMARTQNRPVGAQAEPVRRNANSGITGDKYLQRPYRSAGVKTGRQAVTVTRTGNRTEASEPDGGPGIEEKKLTESPDVLEVLAQLTGMDRVMLKEILMAYGMPEETLTAQEGFIEAAAMLSDILGLDGEQQDALAELMKLLGDAAGVRQEAELAVAAEEDHPAEGAQVIASGNGTEASVTSQGGLTLISEFADRLRTAILEKLEEYASRQENGTDVPKEEAGDAILDMLEKVRNVRSNAAYDAGAGPETGQVSDAAVSDAGEEARAEVEKTGIAETGGENVGGKELKPLEQQDTEQVNDDSMADAGMFALQQNRYEQDAQVQVLADRPMDHTVSAREIISQITGKAAVTLTQDRSEMVIELKPESLGRLSLKVVTENGIVMAKFVAENAQVQKLLESNMQMLKESLERQGIIVQSLNVSVRQDGGQAQENGLHNRGPAGIRQRGISPMPAARIPDMPGLAETPEIKDPWLWQGSTINLTA